MEVCILIEFLKNQVIRYPSGDEEEASRHHKDVNVKA